MGKVSTALALAKYGFIVFKDFLIMNFLLNVGIAPDSAVTFYVKK